MLRSTYGGYIIYKHHVHSRLFCFAVLPLREGYFFNVVFPRGVVVLRPIERSPHRFSHEQPHRLKTAAAKAAAANSKHQQQTASICAGQEPPPTITPGSTCMWKTRKNRSFSRRRCAGQETPPIHIHTPASKGQGLTL